jgi:hypothetical protein
MWLGITHAIRANHMISLLTSSTTDHRGMTFLPQSQSCLFLMHVLSPGFVARVTRRVLLVDHDFRILSEQMSSLPDFQWDTRCSILSFLCLYFKIIVCPVSCGHHYIICPSLINGLWLPLCYHHCSLTVIFSFLCMFCRSLFVLLCFFWPLCCLSFDIRILIAPLVSSNSSWNYPHQFILSSYFGWNKNLLLIIFT